MESHFIPKLESQRWIVTTPFTRVFSWVIDWSNDHACSLHYRLHNFNPKDNRDYYFDSLDECVAKIHEISKPPFVELTLKDFRVTNSNDHAVNYGNESCGRGFTFLCEELKFASMGIRYNSAAEVIAAINEKRRKEYDANR